MSEHCLFKSVVENPGIIIVSSLSDIITRSKAGISIAKLLSP